MTNEQTPMTAEAAMEQARQTNAQNSAKNADIYNAKQTEESYQEQARQANAEKADIYAQERLMNTPPAVPTKKDIWAPPVKNDFAPTTPSAPAPQTETPQTEAPQTEAPADVVSSDPVIEESVKFDQEDAELAATDPQVQNIMEAGAAAEAGSDDDKNTFLEMMKGEIEQLKSDFDDVKKRRRAGTVGTIISAILSSLTGGLVPVIPFNKLTKADTEFDSLNQSISNYQDKVSSALVEAEAPAVATEVAAEIDEDTLQKGTDAQAKQTAATQSGSKKTTDESQEWMAKYDRGTQRILKDMDSSFQRDIEMIRQTHEMNKMKELNDEEINLFAQQIRALQSNGVSEDDIERYTKAQMAKIGINDTDKAFQRAGQIVGMVTQTAGAVLK